MNRLSKHLTRILAAAALALLALCTGASAATRTFALPRYLANPGGTVEVPVTLDDASGLAAIRVRINFDPELLQLQSVKAGPLGKAFELSHGKGEGFVQLLLFRAGSLAGGSGRLAVLKFKANPGAKAKEYSDLAIADIGLSDSSGVIRLRQKDSLRLKNGQVAVTLSPDINNGGSGPAEFWKDLQPLSGITLAGSDLKPAFSPSVTSYTASVAGTVASIKIRPALADPNATVKVNGQPVKPGSASSPVLLDVGGNTITVRVSSQNGTRLKTYKIKVTRGEATGSSDASLAALVVNTAPLAPKFKVTTTTYTANVPASTKTLRIKATSTLGSAKIKINGTRVESGNLSEPIPLKTGPNAIKIVVTAQDGSTKTYQIAITRAKPPAAPVLQDFLAAAMIRPRGESMVARESEVSKVVQDGQKYLQLTIRRNPGTPKPVVEVSPNLVDWFSGDKHTTILLDDGAVLKVRDNTPITPDAKRFIRTRGGAGALERD
ncbi:MAG: cadherin-like beta sandwich domain-containing protein [Luteolibacter sp.]|uniref:cadherin-like beta sandwich domain-containing protein n=1 Tax=Luteolibacter sp. TaxID=1962973 RepID=UPI0032636BA9